MRNTLVAFGIVIVIMIIGVFIFLYENGNAPFSTMSTARPIAVSFTKIA